MSRPGLYVLVFLSVLNSCSASEDARKAAETLKRIADLIPGAQAQPR